MYTNMHRGPVRYTEQWLIPSGSCPLAYVADVFKSNMQVPAFWGTERQQKHISGLSMFCYKLRNSGHVFITFFPSLTFKKNQVLSLWAMLELRLQNLHHHTYFLPQDSAEGSGQISSGTDPGFTGSPAFFHIGIGGCVLLLWSKGLRKETRDCQPVSCPGK